MAGGGADCKYGAEARSHAWSVLLPLSCRVAVALVAWLRSGGWLRRATLSAVLP